MRLPPHFLQKVLAVTLQSSKLIADLKPLSGSAPPFLRRRAAGLFPLFSFLDGRLRDYILSVCNA